MDSERATTARNLVAARRDNRVLETYPGAEPETLEIAYAIQDEAMALRGTPVGGWKLGRIGAEFRESHRADRLAGPIFSDQIVHAASRGVPQVPVLRGFAAVEAELLLLVGRTVPAEASLEQIPAYIEQIRLGLEIASSPLPFINENGPAVTASDFGNNHGLVIGPDLGALDPEEVFATTVAMKIDGRRVGIGQAASTLDGPYGSVAFLARLLAQRGRSLEAGTWVSTGAITGVHPAKPGQEVEAILGGTHAVRCTLIPSGTISVVTA